MDRVKPASKGQRLSHDRREIVCDLERTGLRRLVSERRTTWALILAFVTVFQFIEKLPDRQAAEMMRVRQDWKYALHLPLEYEGSNFSVLSEFRDRLLQGQAEGRVFEELVEQIRALGLIKERGKQRSDSIAMLTRVRWLSRLEVAVETLQLTVARLVQVERD